MDGIGEWIGCTWASPTTASDRPNRQARLLTAQIVYLQSASLLLGISQSYSSVRLVNRNAVSAPRKTSRPFPRQGKTPNPPRLERIFVIAMPQSRRRASSQLHYSSPSSLRAALLAPLVLLAELLVSLILGCGVLFVVGAADVSFCEDESSSSFSSGCSCSCF